MPRVRMKPTVAGLVLVFLLSVSARVLAQEERSGTTAIAGGLGVSVGLLGARFAHRLGGLPLAAVLGLGFEGVAPQLQIDLLSFGNANLHVGGGVLYNPWGFLVLSAGSVLPFGTVGVQRWPYRWQRGGLFLNAEVEIVKLVRGHAEGSNGDRVTATVGGQIGIAF